MLGASAKSRIDFVALMEEAAIPQPSRSSPLAHLHEGMGAVSLLWNNMFVPARYSSDINAEHFAIRTKAGLTDMTGIHKIFLSGREAFEFLNHTVTRDLSVISPGTAVYTVLLNNVGKVIDDAVVFHLDDQAKNYFGAEWLICLGAGLGSQYIHKQTKKKKLNIYRDEGLACLLVQGPKAHDLLASIMSQSQARLPARFQHVISDFEGYTTLISRNSYSGEDGFELFVRDAGASKIFSQLVRMGADPVGFEALNIARIEAGLLFFGQDITGNETPTELGLNFTVDWNNHNFRGKSAFLENRKKPKIKTVGMLISPPSLLRGNEKLLIDGNVRGLIRSFARSEWLNKTIAIAHIEVAHAIEGQEFSVFDDNFSNRKEIVAKTCSRRFYNQLM